MKCTLLLMLIITFYCHICLYMYFHYAIDNLSMLTNLLNEDCYHPDTPLEFTQGFGWGLFSWKLCYFNLA